MKRISMLLVCLATCLATLAIGTSFSRPAHASIVCPGPSATPLGYVSASAYVLDVRLATLGSFGSGPYNAVSLGCDSDQDSATNAAISGNLGPLASFSLGSAQAKITHTATSVSVQEKASIGQVSMLGGLVSADAIEASAESTGTAKDAVSKNTSLFVDMMVAGIPIKFVPPPNTVIPLKGIGTITLNEQTTVSSTTDLSDISVTAIDINVQNINIYGLPIGGHIRIAHVQSSYSRNAPQIISGFSSTTASQQDTSATDSGTMQQNTITRDNAPVKQDVTGGSTVTNAGTAMTTTDPVEQDTTSTAAGPTRSTAPNPGSNATQQNGSAPDMGKAAQGTAMSGSNGSTQNTPSTSSKPPDQNTPASSDAGNHVKSGQPTNSNLFSMLAGLISQLFDWH